MNLTMPVYLGGGEDHSSEQPGFVKWENIKITFPSSYSAKRLAETMHGDAVKLHYPIDYEPTENENSFTNIMGKGGYGIPPPWAEIHMLRDNEIEVYLHREPISSPALLRKPERNSPLSYVFRYKRFDFIRAEAGAEIELPDVLEYVTAPDKMREVFQLIVHPENKMDLAEPLAELTIFPDKDVFVYIGEELDDVFTEISEERVGALYVRVHQNLSRIVEDDKTPLIKLNPSTKIFQISGIRPATESALTNAFEYMLELSSKRSFEQLEECVMKNQFKAD